MTPSISPAASPSASFTGHDEPARVLAASHVLTVSGLLFVLAAIAAPGLLTAFYELVRSGAPATDMNAASRLGAALFGALTFGWGVTVRLLARGAGLVRALRLGVTAWFVVDSAASVALGYAWNTLSNAGFLLVVLLLLGWRRG